MLTKGMKRIVNAFFFSIAGLSRAVKSETAFQQELALAFVLVPVAFFLKVSPAEKSLLVFSVFSVLIVELLNTAIESVVDRIGREQHELSKAAKDFGSAAVFISLSACLFVWIIILF